MRKGQFEKGKKPWNFGVKGRTGLGTPNYRRGTAKKWTSDRAIPKSIYKGVCYKKQDKRAPRWIAQITVDYKTMYLGSFPFTDTGERMAARAYENAAEIYFSK